LPQNAVFPWGKQKYTLNLAILFGPKFIILEGHSRMVHSHEQSVESLIIPFLYWH